MNVVTLKNEKLEVEILDVGATLLSFKHKQDGQNIVLRYQDMKAYSDGASLYLGACIGPVAGRVEKGMFGPYKLALNDGENHLHGGVNGIHNAVFSVEKTDDSATFSLSQDHTLDGYPGIIHYEICYRLSEETLVLEFNAWPEKAHYLNITNHAYFNLDGGDTIAHHRLKIMSHYVGELDATLANRGAYLNVSDTVLDFRDNPLLSKTLEGHHEQFEFTRNLDHMFYIDKLMLSVGSKQLTIATTAPGFQVYSANFFEGAFVDEKGRLVKNHAGLAIEPQRPANEVNFNREHPIYSKQNPFKTKTLYSLSFK